MASSDQIAHDLRARVLAGDPLSDEEIIEQVRALSGARPSALRGAGPKADKPAPAAPSGELDIDAIFDNDGD